MEKKLITKTRHALGWQGLLVDLFIKSCYRDGIKYQGEWKSLISRYDEVFKQFPIIKQHFPITITLNCILYLQ